MNAGCAGKTEITRERVPYLSALEVCPRLGAVQIHVYLSLALQYSLSNSVMMTLTFKGHFSQGRARKCWWRMMGSGSEASAESKAETVLEVRWSDKQILWHTPTVNFVCNFADERSEYATDCSACYTTCRRRMHPHFPGSPSSHLPDNNLQHKKSIITTGSRAI